jgi:nitrate reductase gamma subunit
VSLLTSLSFRAITAFALEKYPNQAAVVSAIINMWRTCGGFAVGYFQPSWIARDGVAAVFGTQAAVVAVCVILLIGSAILLGRRAAQRNMTAAPSA